MSFQIFGQRDPQWSGHALGSGAGEMGAFGCFEVCFTMVVHDAYLDMQYDPASLDDTLWNAGVFQGDNLPDNALDRVWPDRFSTHVEGGFNAGNVAAAVASPDTYAIVSIHNPAVGVTAYHFMVMLSASLVADPWWGKVMTLAAWGGPDVVVKTIYVKSLKAQRDAAIAAAAAQVAAVAQAKAIADAAAVTATAAVVAAAKAKADASAAVEAAAKAAADAATAAAAAAQVATEEAAKEQAATDAREAAAHAAAEAAARASQPAGKVQPPTNAPAFTALQALLVLLIRLLAPLFRRRTH